MTDTKVRFQYLCISYMIRTHDPRNNSRLATTRSPILIHIGFRCNTHTRLLVMTIKGILLLFIRFLNLLSMWEYIWWEESYTSIIMAATGHTRYLSSPNRHTSNFSCMDQGVLWEENNVKQMFVVTFWRCKAFSGESAHLYRGSWTKTWHIWSSLRTS